MSVTIQPINQDDGAMHPVNPFNDFSKIDPQVLKEMQGEPVNTRGIIEVRPDLFTNIDPTINDKGIVTSMTVKPVGEHTIDLKSQISDAVQVNNPQELNIIMSDINQSNPGGGADVMSGQQIMGGGAFATPDDQHKAALGQSPQPNTTQDKPNIIISQM